MKEPKKYTVKKDNGKGRETYYTGTVEELTNIFSYTLEIGNSWNKKINRNPKTIKSFITNINKAFNEKETNIYTRTSVELVAD